MKRHVITTGGGDGDGRVYVEGSKWSKRGQVTELVKEYEDADIQLAAVLVLFTNYWVKYGGSAEYFIDYARMKGSFFRKFSGPNSIVPRDVVNALLILMQVQEFKTAANYMAAMP